MSWEVSHAYWHWWRPGAHEENSPHDPEYKAYVKRAGKRNSEHRLLLLALALDAMPIMPFDEGPSESAACTTSIDTLALMLQRSRSTVKRLIRELQRWGELEVDACDGYCRYGGRKRHAGTNHYRLPLPVGAEPWKARHTRRI